MVPTTPNLSPWGKSFPKNVFFILVQVLFFLKSAFEWFGDTFYSCLQKHSPGRICLLPGECWTLPKLLTLVTIFIRLCMSSPVSQVILKKSPAPHIFWP